jgi:hypothetical protein
LHGDSPHPGGRDDLGCSKGGPMAHFLFLLPANWKGIKPW